MPSKQRNSLPGMAAEQNQPFFAFAVRWGAKVRSTQVKKSKIQPWENFEKKTDSNTGNQQSFLPNNPAS